MVARLIAMKHFHTVKLLGLEPFLIIVPFTKEQQAWLWHTDTMWQNALANFTGQHGEHFLSSKHLNFAPQHAFIFPQSIREDPMPQALVIFTDASGSGNTAYFSFQGQKIVQTGFFTAQRAELQVVILACQDFVHVPFNLYTDSAYIYGVLKTVETVYIGLTNDEQLFNLIHELKALLQQCQHPYSVGHLWWHSGLPGPLAEGNCQADALVPPLTLQVDTSSPVNQAIQSHSQFHQNSRALNIFISPKNKLIKLLSHVQNMFLICLCTVREFTLVVFPL
jgi:hypothetical protein